MEYEYSIEAIRELLEQSFNDEEFKALCQSHFKQVYKQITRGMSFGEMTTRLVDYCDGREQFEKLLSLVARENPQQYVRFEERLRRPITQIGPRQVWIKHRVRRWIRRHKAITAVTVVVASLIIIGPIAFYLLTRPLANPRIKIPGSVYHLGTITSPGCSDYDKNSPAGIRVPFTVTLQTFALDQYEVTNYQYNQCVLKGPCERPDAKWNEDWRREIRAEIYDNPIVGVTWYQAEQFCRWVGGHLPTEDQWEAAARGRNGWEYPWGNDWVALKGNIGRPDLKVAKVNDFAEEGKDRSPFRVIGLAGNVTEWTSSPYLQDNPDLFKIVKGGSYQNDQGWCAARSAHRFRYPPSEGRSTIGFRCAYSIEAK